MSNLNQCTQSTYIQSRLKKSTQRLKKEKTTTTFSQLHHPRLFQKKKKKKKSTPLKTFWMSGIERTILGWHYFAVTSSVYLCFIKCLPVCFGFAMWSELFYTAKTSYVIWSNSFVLTIYHNGFMLFVFSGWLTIRERGGGAQKGRKASKFSFIK